MKRTFLALTIALGLAWAACGGSGGPVVPEDVLGDTPGDLATDPGTDTFVPDEGRDPGTDTFVPDEGQDPGTDTFVPEDVTPDVEPDVCAPDCGVRICGPSPNGCGSCGECPVGTCTEAGTCDCDNPTTWGPVGMVVTAEFPGATESAAICPDFNDDGEGDNAVGPFADQVNARLQSTIEKRFYGAVAEFIGVSDWTNQDNFTINLFAAGTEDAESTALYANPLWYNPAICTPWIHAQDATIAEGVLTVPPHDYFASATWRGILAEGTVKMAQMTGTVASTADGVTLTGGVLAGVVTKADIDAAIVIVKAQCEGEGELPNFCGDLGLLDLVDGVYDLDLDDDGEMDAASVCVKFTLGPATILGYGVEE